MMKRQRLFTAVPRDQWSQFSDQGHIDSEPVRTEIDVITGRIQSRPAHRVWWTDRRRADQVFRTENNYEGTVRIIGVRRGVMPTHHEVAQGPGWRCYVTTEPVSLQDVEVSDWQMDSG